MNIFDTAVLAQVVAYLPASPSWLLDRYFRIEQRNETEEIYFDVEGGARRLAPLVSPLVQGKIVTSKGYKTNNVRPAYVKDKRVFDPSRPLKRAIGEQIGGAISPMERIQINLRTDLSDQISMITRRMEWMAASALYSGTITLSGEGYQTVVVDFGRDPGLTIAKLAGAKWSDADVNPLNDLQDWALLMLQKSGVSATEVTMTADVWKVFRDNPYVADRWNTLNEHRAALDLSAVTTPGGRVMGTIDGFTIIVYADWYLDPATGDEKPMIPAGTVILTGPQIEGVRAYGAIKDEEAGYQALPYFPKSWVEKDPSVRYLLTQSAPLAYPSRPNGTLRATVL